jgi:ATP-dependent RNA helicase RhlE
MGGQVRALLRGVDILIATPGRLLDLLQSNALRLDRVECLVLDEADRMLDMGFIHDIRKIVAKTPTSRQTLFFSATMPPAIAELAGQMLRNPSRISVAPVAATADRVEQRLIHVDRAGKPAALADLLKREPIDRVLVFTRTKHGADKVVRGLVKAGIAAEAIHGNKSQNQRARVLAAFRSGQIRTLIATDIAARGIDVDGVSHVVNYDLPDVPESYVHRIGRTARAGAEGVAISFCTPDELPMLRAIEKLIRISIPASGQRTTSHAANGSVANGRHAQSHRRGKQRRRRKGRAADDRTPHRNHELTAVAFLHRGRPGDQRRPSTNASRHSGAGHVRSTITSEHD